MPAEFQQIIAPVEDFCENDVYKAERKRFDYVLEGFRREPIKMHVKEPDHDCGDFLNGYKSHCAQRFVLKHIFLEWNMPRGTKGKWIAVQVALPLHGRSLLIWFRCSATRLNPKP